MSAWRNGDYKIQSVKAVVGEKSKKLTCAQPYAIISGVTTLTPSILAFDLRVERSFWPIALLGESQIAVRT